MAVAAGDGSLERAFFEAIGRGRAKRRVAVARSGADAPEIDGIVHVEGGGELPPGTFARVTVTAAGEHDLVATLAR